MVRDVTVQLFITCYTVNIDVYNHSFLHFCVFVAFHLSIFIMDSADQGSDRETSTDKSTLVSEDGKNIKSVVCQRCASKVLCPGMAVFTEKQVRLFGHLYKQVIGRLSVQIRESTSHKCL